MTRITTIQDVAHAFFYADEKDKFERRYMSVSFSGRVFYSYWTVIAAVVNDKAGKPVTLLSRDNMSMTTAKHINAVWDASPHNVLWVPFEYGEHHFSIDFVVRNFEKELERTSKLRMTRAENRSEFSSLYAQAKVFSERVQTLKFLRKYTKLYSDLQNDEKVKELKAKQREKDAAKIAKVKAEFKKLRKTHSYLELLEIAYAQHGEFSAKLRKLFNPHGDLAFVWRDRNGDYRTSKGVLMNKSEGDCALNLWKHNKLRHGMRLGIYTVLSITDKFVKIGCHNIPVENLKAL